MKYYLNFNYKKILAFVWLMLSIYFLTGCANSNYQSETAICTSPLRYDVMDTSEICYEYFRSGNRACDHLIIQEFDKRNVRYRSKLECGQPNITMYSPKPVLNEPQICSTESFSQFDYKTLCRIYLNNENISCNSQIQSELSSRSLKITPYEECGQNLLNSPVENEGLIIPSDIGNSCMDLIKSFTTNALPIKAACDFRYKSVIRESIICRKQVKEFITLNSKGVGNSSRDCGLQ